MIINQQLMDEINAVQCDIFKAFHNVCAELNLKYYLVHGSLLGAIKHQGFFPFDDDIDVAMPRKDYNVLIKQGKDLFSSKFFVQSYLSDRDLPIIFCKIRDNETTFIQPVLSSFNVNQGIYIDVFPIDNYPVNKWQKKYLRLKGWLLSSRVRTRFNTTEKKTFKQKMFSIFVKVLYPSWKLARDMYCKLYNNVSNTGKVIVRGGKASEVNISSDYFGIGHRILFEGIESYAPQRTEDYLELIYGDYSDYKPMGKDMVSENEVKISASIVDVHKSYKEFLNL